MDNKHKLEDKYVPLDDVGLTGEERPPIGGYTPSSQQKITVGKTLSMRDDWYDTVIDHLKREGGGTDESKKLQYALRKEELGTRPKDEDLGKNIIKDDDLEQVFPLDLPRQLVSRVSNVTGKPLDQTGLEVRDSYIRHLNKDKDWKTIEHDITEPGGDTLTSRITPVNEEFQKTFKDYGKTGLGSMSGRLTPEKRTEEEKERPVNLWHTSLEKGDETLFEGFRSGAFVDTSSDPDERKHNSDERAKGVLQAMLIEKLGKMSDDDRKSYLEGGATYNGTMVSIDLLSGTGGDRSMATQHHETLSRVNKTIQNYDVQWGDKSYSVPAKFDIIDFMTGVNGMNKDVGPLPNFGIFKDSPEQSDFNENSWGKLLEQVKSFETVHGESENPEIQEKLTKIRTLTQGVDETGLGKSGSYQLPALIANLAYQLGDSVHFNCKSGKDRTGIMDSETKFMARQLDKQSGEEEMVVPNVSNPKHRDDEQNYEHEQMLWESGSLDVLAQNVGGQCLKTADCSWVPGGSDQMLSKNLGGSKKMKELGGLKRYGDIDTISTFEQKNIKQQLEPLSKKEKKKYSKQGREYVEKLPDVKPLPQPPKQKEKEKKSLEPTLDEYTQGLEEVEDLVEDQPLVRPKGVPKGAYKYI